MTDNHENDTDTNAPTRNQPVDTIRYDNLKASIWRNEGEFGPYYPTSFARTYKDSEGNYRDAHSFAGSDLLKIAELARAAHMRAHNMLLDERKDTGERGYDALTPDSEARRAAFKEKRSAQASPEQAKHQDK